MLTPCGPNCPDILLQILIFGLTNGAVLALNAISVTVIYGTVRALNLAHGDTFALTTVVITTLIRALGVQRGDRVVIYTDGVTEAMSPEGAEFTSERLISITTQAANAPSSQYLTTLVNALQAHAQSDDQHDDITIVTVKVG